MKRLLKYTRYLIIIFTAITTIFVLSLFLFGFPEDDYTKEFIYNNNCCTSKYYQTAYLLGDKSLIKKEPSGKIKYTTGSIA